MTNEDLITIRVMIMTHFIASKDFEGKSSIWVSVMTHLEYALKSRIQSNVLPYICVGGTSKLVKSSSH